MSIPKDEWRGLRRRCAVREDGMRVSRPSDSHGRAKSKAYRRTLPGARSYGRTADEARVHFDEEYRRLGALRLQVNQRRIKAIEVNLTPSQFVLLWMRNAIPGCYEERAFRSLSPCSEIANAVANIVRTALKGEPEASRTLGSASKCTAAVAALASIFCVSENSDVGTTTVSA